MSANLLTATEASAEMSAGTLTSLELVDACLARIAAREGDVRAFAHLDPDYARAQARAADALRKQGKGVGPLHGIPVGVKDIIDTADMPTQNGCKAFEGHQPTADAFCVSALRAAGAVILGKTVTTELATLTPPPTRNPRDLAHTPGGSSSGSAAGVADAMLPLALATQTGGSVIRPASFCGIYALKPTLGLISRRGVTLQSHTLDTVGVYGRSVADLALIADALAVHDPDDAVSYARSRPNLSAVALSTPPTPPKFAFVRTPGWDEFVEPATKDALAEFIGRLGDRCTTIGLADFAMSSGTPPPNPYNGWASSYGLDPSVTTGPNAGAPAADPDNDTFTNQQEFSFGTNPTVGSPALLSTELSGGNLVVRWLERAGVTYTPQSTANLATTPFGPDGAISVGPAPSAHWGSKRESSTRS